MKRVRLKKKIHSEGRTKLKLGPVTLDWYTATPKLIQIKQLFKKKKTLKSVKENIKMAQRESIANRGYSRQDPLINTNRNTFRTHHHDTPLMTTYRQPSIISSHHPTPNSAAIYSPYHNHHQPLSIMPLQQPQQQPRREEITRWSTHQPPPPNRVLSSRQQYPQTASRNLGPPSPHQSSLLASTQNKARESETPKSSTPSTTKKNQSVKPTPSPKISKTVVDPNRPALLVPDPIPVDHDFEEMSSGLKLQQQVRRETNVIVELTMF